MLTSRQYESVGLKFVLDRLECHSYYGTDEIRSLNYKVHDGVPLAELREDLQEVFANMNGLLGLTDRQTAALQECLHRFKNINGCIRKFEGSYLLEVDLFELKGFMLAHEQFRFLWNGLPVRLCGLSFTDLTLPLDILDKNGQRTAPFHISHEDKPALMQARLEKEKIENMIHKHGLSEELTAKRSVWAQKEDELERQALKELTDKLRPYAAEFLTNAKNIGRLDFLLAKAVLAKETGAVCPGIMYKASSQSCICPDIAQETIRFVNMWNPYTKDELIKKGRDFTKISIELPPGCAVITGANMGGKSIAIKTVLLNVALANMGFFVFAEEATLPLFDDLYLVEEENGDNFLSSFGAEILQINRIVKKIEDERIFIALDEPARATNPYEGAKIACGLVAFLEKQKSTALVSTHYDDVHREAGTHYQTAGFEANVGANIDELKNSVNYELKRMDKNAKVPACAIKICEILGLHAPLLEQIRRLG